MNNPLSELIRDYINQRKQKKLETAQKSLKKAEEEALVDPAKVQEQREKCEQIRQSYLERHWLEDASRRAAQINFVSHAPKYTHSDAKGSGFFCHMTDNHQSTYLGTKSLPHRRTDVTGNAAALDVAGLLQLSIENQLPLYQQLATGDNTALAPFAPDEETLQRWCSGFLQVLNDSSIQSHTLAKQIYWPTSQHKSGYTILQPLFASSLTQSLYERVQHNKFSDSAKLSRQLRKAEKPPTEDASRVDISHPSLAVMKFGGTKPQNISLLNSQRYGQAYLLNTAPPVWKSPDKPPRNEQDFWGQFIRRAYSSIHRLGHFLTESQHQDSTQFLRKTRKNLVEDILDHLIQLGAEIQQAQQQQAPHFEAGWSRGNNDTGQRTLPTSLAAWLDPRREEVTTHALNQARDQASWVDEVATHFATVLNTQIAKKTKLNLQQAEHREWREQAKDSLNSTLRSSS